MITRGDRYHSFSAKEFPPSSADPTRNQLFLLEIENKDNPPLQVKQVKSSHLEYYLVTYLDTKNQYRLATGSSELETPEYDLRQFSDSIPATPSLLAHGPLQTAITSNKAGFSWSQNWHWIVLVAGMAVLALFIFRVMKDMKKQGV